jgi:hypothetical protein
MSIFMKFGTMNKALLLSIKIFQRCLAGAARDLWDQIKVLEEEDGERDNITFQFHMRELMS